MLTKFREIECITQPGIIDLVAMSKNIQFNRAGVGVCGCSTEVLVV